MSAGRGAPRDASGAGEEHRLQLCLPSSARRRAALPGRASLWAGPARSAAGPGEAALSGLSAGSGAARTGAVRGGAAGAALCAGPGGAGPGCQSAAAAALISTTE